MLEFLDPVEHLIRPFRFVFQKPYRQEIVESWKQRTGAWHLVTLLEVLYALFGFALGLVVLAIGLVFLRAWLLGD